METIVHFDIEPIPNLAWKEGEKNFTKKILRMQVHKPQSNDHRSFMWFSFDIIGQYYVELKTESGVTIVNSEKVIAEFSLNESQKDEFNTPHGNWFAYVIQNVHHSNDTDIWYEALNHIFLTYVIHHEFRQLLEKEFPEWWALKK